MWFYIQFYVSLSWNESVLLTCRMPPKKIKFYGCPNVNAGDLARKLRGPKEEIRFLQKVGFLPMSKQCRNSNCGAKVTSVLHSRKSWQCKSCRTEEGVAKHTVLENSKLPIMNFILLVYYFCVHPKMTQKKGLFGFIISFDHFFNSSFLVIFEIGNRDRVFLSSDEETDCAPARSPPNSVPDCSSDDPHFTKMSEKTLRYFIILLSSHIWSYSFVCHRKYFGYFREVIIADLEKTPQNKMIGGPGMTGYQTHPSKLLSIINLFICSRDWRVYVRQT